MKQFFRPVWVILCALLALCCTCAFAEETAETPVFVLPAASGSVELHPEVIDEELWLFLPAFAQMEDLRADGAELEWWDMEPDEEGLWYVDVLLSEEETLTVNVMRSENLRSLFLFSDDPVKQGRAFVEDQSSKHENEAPASLALLDAQGNLCHAEHIEKLRGRGNTTWSFAEKKSYQLKLDDPVDLLDTANIENAAEKWLLMAEFVDDTMLHNQVCMDLGRELGLNVMESEFVDLYYDGIYRGTYRLSEKVEIEQGRIEGRDYDQLIKKWNNKLGQRDLNVLQTGEGINRYGNPFTYIEGVVDNQQAGSGAYLVEMENAQHTLTDRCWFRLNGDPDRTVYALKNPENASGNAVTYISERLQEARFTLRAGGVNPENGRTAVDDFDLDAFARTLMVHELSRNMDGYTHSSSFFVLPEESSRFMPGVMWDMDLSFRRCGRGPYGFKDNSEWMTDFYRVPEFLKIAQRVYCDEIYPLVQRVLLGKECGTYLKPLDQYMEHIRASREMNDRLWQLHNDSRYMHGNCFEEDVQLFRLYVKERNQWLYDAMSIIGQEDGNSRILLWMEVPFANPEKAVLYGLPWESYRAEVVSSEMISEADEEHYAVWRIEVTVAAGDGRSLEDCAVFLNGVKMETIRQSDDVLLIRAEFEDQSYRPVDYYGDDVGWVYNFDQYIEWYPEIAAECEYDEETVKDYFFDQGIYEGHTGNGLFSPKEVAELQPSVAEYLYDDWSMYYWEFLEWGYEAGWMDHTAACFMPTVIAIPEEVERK